MTSFQSSELTKLPVVENSQLFAQRAHSARYAPLVKKMFQIEYEEEAREYVQRYGTGLRWLQANEGFGGQRSTTSSSDRPLSSVNPSVWSVARAAT